MKKEVYEAVSILIGMTIGAGVLGIPYVISKSGFLIGFLFIILIGLAIMTINLFFGEIVLRTKGDHQLTGYAERYLGKFGKIIISITMTLGIYGALIAYLIVGSESLSAIFTGPVIYYLIGYFILMALIVLFGFKTIVKSEFIISGMMIFVVLIICLVGFTKIDFSNLKSVNVSYLFYPYGIILFAYLGLAAVPEMKEELVKNKKDLKKAIMIGALIPMVVYLLFAFVVVGVTGKNTTEIATLGLSNIFGWQIVLFGNLFALFAVSTGFLALGLALKEMYNYDYKLNKYVSWALVCFIPFIFLLLFRNVNFRDIINVSGVLTGGIEGIIVILMFYRAKKYGDRKPEYSLNKNYLIGALIMLMFILGIIFGLNLF
ncbi:MAG: aromatic amino acid transport family protein [archaeon]